MPPHPIPADPSPDMTRHADASAQETAATTPDKSVPHSHPHRPKHPKYELHARREAIGYDPPREGTKATPESQTENTPS